MYIYFFSVYVINCHLEKCEGFQTKTMQVGLHGALLGYTTAGCHRHVLETDVDHGIVHMNSVQKSCWLII